MQTNLTLTYGVLVFLSIGLLGAATFIILGGVILYAVTILAKRAIAFSKQFSQQKHHGKLVRPSAA